MNPVVLGTRPEGAYALPCFPLPSTMVAVTVYLVRHGETQENRDGIMQGQLDTQLNAAGREQAQRTAAALEKVRFTEAHASDLRRAVQVRSLRFQTGTSAKRRVLTDMRTQTAEAILAKHPGVVLETHAALRERVRTGLAALSAPSTLG